MKDLTFIIDGSRTNVLNAILLGGLCSAMSINALALGQLDLRLGLALGGTLGVGLLVLVLPLAQLAKCLIVPSLPAMATTALVLQGGGQSWYYLTILGSVAMGSLYFQPKIVLAHLAFANLLIVALLLTGHSPAGFSASLSDNINHLVRLDLVALIIFVATKWGHDHAATAREQTRKAFEADRNLLELNATLEEKVKERTSQLAEMVNDLRETQAHLIMSEKQASLGSLVAGVAHEVNTPLGICITAISKLEVDHRGFRDAVEGNTLTRTGLADHVNITGETIDILSLNLTRAAETIRSFKEIAVDQNSEVLAQFVLDDYIRTILASLRHELKNRKADIAVNFSEFRIESYPGAFSHIITNLIMNTLMHGYDPWARIQIDFDARREPDGSVVFRYTDHGKGIPPEIIGRIFDPFFTTRRGTGGSGLGLNIVYNTVRDKLHGTICCESEPGEHTTFTIRF